MLEKATQAKGAKKSAKRKLTEEVPERKSSRLAGKKPEYVPSSSTTAKKTDKPATKKRGKAAPKNVKSEKEEDDVLEMADQPESDWENAKSVHIKGEVRTYKCVPRISGTKHMCAIARVETSPRPATSRQNR